MMCGVLPDRVDHNRQFRWLSASFVLHIMMAPFMTVARTLSHRAVTFTGALPTFTIEMWLQK
jgi:hypothetical protein